jgi:hypothetical protein
VTQVFAIFVVFVGVIGVAGVSAGLKRRGEIRELAAKNQWQQLGSDRRLPGTFGGEPFQHGHGRVAQNVLRGRHNDHDVLIFDYLYRTSGSESDETHRHWVACVEDLPAALPPLEVVQRRWTKGNVSRLGGFEVRTGDAAFDDRYRVTTGSAQLAADVLTPELVRLLSSWPDLPWRIEGRRLLTWGKGTMKPHWVEPALNMLTQLAETVPPEVWRSAGQG